MHRTTIAASCLALALIVGGVERLSGMWGTLWVLILIPVGTAAWYLGWRWGAAFGCLGAGLGMLIPGGPSGAEMGIRMALLAAFALIAEVGRTRMESSREPIRSDPSTGLANSRALFDSVAQEVERAQRYGRPFTVAYVAVENLPAVQQRSGEAAAEDVMRRIAHHIRGSLRGVDLAARLRGREFALLLPETGVDAARAVLSRTERSLSASLAEEPLSVTFSIGAITWISSDLPVKSLHQRTYQLMYAARKAGTRLEHEVLDASMAEPQRVPYLMIR
jgi:diguanylate cyclase (GGDEF)-like protein